MGWKIIFSRQTYYQAHTHSISVCNEVTLIELLIDIIYFIKKYQIFALVFSLKLPLETKKCFATFSLKKYFIMFSWRLETYLRKCNY